MNYCSLEDAWGEKPSMLPKKQVPKEKEPTKEKFSMITKDDERLSKIKKHVEEIYSCDGMMNHLRHCRTCYNKMKQNFVREPFKSDLMEHFEGMIDENRESIVLILVGISILLFINLINNVTKGNNN